MATSKTPEQEQAERTAFDQQIKLASARAYVQGFGIVLAAHGHDMTKAAAAAKPRLEAALAMTEKKAKAVDGVMAIVNEIRTAKAAPVAA